MSSLVNIHRLGYKEAAGNNDGYLGAEGCFEDINLNSTALIKPKMSNSLVKAIWVQSASGTALVPGTLAACSVVAKTVSGITGAELVVDGVVDPYLTENVANTEKFWLIVGGPTPVRSGAAFSANDALEANAAGKAITKSGTILHTNFGRALEAATAADQLKRAFVTIRSL